MAWNLKWCLCTVLTAPIHFSIFFLLSSPFTLTNSHLFILHWRSLTEEHPYSCQYPKLVMTVCNKVKRMLLQSGICQCPKCILPQGNICSFVFTVLQWCGSEVSVLAVILTFLARHESLTNLVCWWEKQTNFAAETQGFALNVAVGKGGCVWVLLMSCFCQTALKGKVLSLSQTDVEMRWSVLNVQSNPMVVLAGAMLPLPAGLRRY